jgi:hypothetical protein
VNPQPGLFAEAPNPLPGSLNDSSLVRSALVEAMRGSPLSREEIAERISLLSGSAVTVRRVNAFASESRDDYRFPLELLRALCVAIGDFSPLRRIAEAAGFRLIDANEADLLELGRETLKQKRAGENVALLEKRLQGFDL